MEQWSMNAILLAFGGGIFGASLGALWSFCLCGFLTIAGCLVVLSGGSDFLLLQVGLGPIFGPHTGGFVAGIVAATYAAGLRKNHPTGDAKDILSGLVDTSWDVPLVGGFAAVLGLIMIPILAQIPILNQSDLLALSIIINIWLARLIFQGEMPWGKKSSIKQHGWIGTNNRALSWVPWMAVPSRLAVIGAGVGLLSGGIALGFEQHLRPMVEAGQVAEKTAFIAPLIFGWGLSAFMLTMLQLGDGSRQKTPVTHCMAIIGALGYLYTHSLLVAGLSGLLAAFIQEFCARMFYNHGSNHLDPPAAGITVSTLLMSLLFKTQYLGLSLLFK